MREDAGQRAIEFRKDLSAAGDIGAGWFGTGVTGLLAAKTDTERAGIVRSLPSQSSLPARTGGSPMTSPSGCPRRRRESRHPAAFLTEPCTSPSRPASCGLALRQSVAPPDRTAR